LKRFKNWKQRLFLFCENSQKPETRGTSISKKFKGGFQKHSTKDPSTISRTQNLHKIKELPNIGLKKFQECQR